MSEGTAVAQVPQHILNRIASRQGAKSAALDAIVSGLSFPRVSIRASRYRLIDEGVETVVGTEMDVVFVAVNPKVSKMWYDKAYSSDGDDKTPPACFSNDGVRPDAAIAAPVHDNCAQCPKNVLGSRITPSGKQSKECNDVRFVAVVTAADPSKVYGLTIPVSAMKAFRLYFKELSQYGLIPEEVITTLGFDDQASFPKITFKHKGYVPEKHLKTMEEMASGPETKQIIRVVTGPALAAPRQPSPPSKPVEAARPQIESRVEKDVTPKAEAPTDEPVVPATQAEAPAKPPRPAKAAAAKSADPKPAAAPAGDEAIATLEKQLDDLFG